MKVYDGKFYEVRDREDRFGYGGRLESVKKAREEIEKQSALMKERGYDNQGIHLIIVETQWLRTFDDYGKFLYEETYRKLLEEVIAYG